MASRKNPIIGPLPIHEARADLLDRMAYHQKRITELHKIDLGDAGMPTLKTHIVSMLLQHKTKLARAQRDLETLNHHDPDWE